MADNSAGAKTIGSALISVSDKTGITDFAQGLAAQGVTILSTGGTHARLREAGIAVTEVSEYTGFPEMMDGRVKTLHPKVHGGLLGRRGQDDAVMTEHGIQTIDLVVVNLYPFAATIAKPDCTDADAIENIDIGGPAMLRSAAKNHADVAVVVDPTDYARVLEANSGNGPSQTLRRELALKAFRHTAAYDATVAQYLGEHSMDGALIPQDEFAPTLTLTYSKVQDMRYGENPHQKAAFYVEGQPPAGTVASLVQHQGKELSYNNVADTDAALNCVQAFSEPACVIVKHANPCGVATAQDVATAYQRAFACDTTSAFGGIIAFNRPLDETTLGVILDQQFAEVIVAPSVSDGAQDIAKRKKNVRLLSTGQLRGERAAFLDFKRVGGGILVQEADQMGLDPASLKVVTKRQPTDAEYADLMFAWKVAWFVKSNAIVYARDLQTIGVGAGQMARVTSAQVAGIKAAAEGLTVAGSVMASDAFFPFRDGIDSAAEVGIRAVIEPGGSMRDAEVIEAADEHDMAMVFTGVRHFRH